jgi:hypothetical protein
MFLVDSGPDASEIYRPLGVEQDGRPIVNYDPGSIPTGGDSPNLGFDPRRGYEPVPIDSTGYQSSSTGLTPRLGLTDNNPSRGSTINVDASSPASTYTQVPVVSTTPLAQHTVTPSASTYESA